MRLYIFVISVLISSTAFAVDKGKYTPEQLFVIGTELFKEERKEFDPKLGLEFLLESAKFKYEMAPFGLCVSLSSEVQVLDLQEAFAWCYVAARIGNKYSTLASHRSNEILDKILVDQGVSAVEEAKVLAASRYRE